MRSDALKRAQKNYNLNHDRIYLYLPFGTLARIDKTGIKRPDFIKQAIEEKLTRFESKKNN